MQQITHSECIYAPGEAELVKQAFAALGFGVTHHEGHTYIVAHVDPELKDGMNNCVYASEVTPAQHAFETTLRETLSASPELRTAAEGWDSDFRNDPQRSYHFGIRYGTQEEFEATIDRLRAAGGPGGPLEGRLDVTGVYFPGDPGSITDTMAQAFVWTDLFASGILAFGQHLELQWHIKDLVFA